MKHKKILIVDDDPVVQAIVAQGLIKEGFEVLQAVNGSEAIEKLGEQKPNILILDVILPDMDGTDIAGMLQEKVETGNIPVVYLTSLADKGKGNLSTASNPDMVFTKPVDLSALLKKIKELSDALGNYNEGVFKNESLFQKKGVRKKILVVDDDSYILDLVQARLSHHGFDVVCAVNGKNAILKARQQHPNLIILDVMLPGIDGTEVARLLKEDEETKNIPIIYVTALKNQGDETEMEEMSDAILAKPFDSKQLIAKIEELI